LVLLNTDNKIEHEGAVSLFEALKSNSSLTVLSLGVTELLISFSLNTGNAIGSEGVVRLSDVLKSNTSLTSLYLGGSDLLLHFILAQYR
jgi:hypothetical protein